MIRNIFDLLSLPFDMTLVEKIKALIEIGIISVALYYSILFLKKTRAVFILRGLGTLLMFGICAYIFKLDTIFFILKGLGAVTLIVLPIIFQPELRRALEQMGQSGLWKDRFADLEKKQVIKLIHSLIVTMEDLSIVKMGALIILEQELKLDEYARSGTIMDSELSPELLKTIFFPHTFLHDGALLVRGDRIMAAGTFLPLSENPNLPQNVGSRHRAALGITEVTDAVALVVSEETGRISLAHNGKLIQDIKPDALRELLYSICFPQGTTFSSPVKDAT